MTLPCLRIHPLHLVGPLSLQPFGALVVVGILAGYALALRRARELGVPRREISAAAQCAVIGGLLGAHLFDLFVNRPESLQKQGLVALCQFWSGIDSFGGFLGALMAVVFYFRTIGKPWLRHADALTQGLALGWVFGRLGCALVHDHLEGFSTFWLAIRYPGGARHDLGLYEFLVTGFVIFPVSLFVRHWDARPGMCTAAIALLYGTSRFALDLLRESSRRFAGLTTAQYGSIGLLCLGALLLYRVRSRPGRRQPEAPMLPPKSH